MGEITIRKALDDYKTVYMPYRNFADRTREEYQNDIEDFADFVEQRGMTRVGELELPNIERYVAHLEEKGFSSLTRKEKVVAIRSFLTFLYQDGYIDTNLAKKVLLPFAELISKTQCHSPEGTPLRDGVRERSSATDTCAERSAVRVSNSVSEILRYAQNDIFEITCTIPIPGFPNSE